MKDCIGRYNYCCLPIVTFNTATMLNMDLFDCMMKVRKLNYSLLAFNANPVLTNYVNLHNKFQTMNMVVELSHEYFELLKVIHLKTHGLNIKNGYHPWSKKTTTSTLNIKKNFLPILPCITHSVFRNPDVNQKVPLLQNKCYLALSNSHPKFYTKILKPFIIQSRNVFRQHRNCYLAWENHLSLHRKRYFHSHIYSSICLIRPKMWISTAPA